PPQSTTPPHPSPAHPHSSPSCAHVAATHVAPLPHWFGIPPPPQDCVVGHDPQRIKEAQPSPASPHWMFCSVQVWGTQGPAPPSSAVGCPHRLTPPPPQKSG